jgi:hypothetical protein
MPLVAVTRKRRVPSTSRQGNCDADEPTFCEYNYGIPMYAALSYALAGCMRIQVRPSPLTGNLLVTTRVSLIFNCLRRLLALLHGKNQLAALVQQAQVAIIFVAQPVGRRLASSTHQCPGCKLSG